jgi:hypothetical protein
LILHSCLILLCTSAGDARAMRETGDTADDPFWIPAIPAEFTGDTCSFEDDYAEMCPYGGSSPDIVFAHTAPRDMFVDISMCDSYYDTKIFIYENIVTPGNPYECNDDWCGGPNYPLYLSHLEDVFFAAGNTYYIVVTGYVGACGEYVLQIEESLGPCGLEWPVRALSEGEPDCEDDYIDEYNSGCNSPANAFQVLEPYHQEIIVFGGSGVFLGGGNPKRDSDWYQITPLGETTIDFTCTAEFPVQIYLLDGTEGCGNIVELAAAGAATCETAVISENVTRGVYWLWIGPSVYENVPCTSNYVMTVDGYHATATGLPATDPAATQAPLLSCFPNPSRRSTTIRYELSEAAHVTVTVHDVAGRRLRLLSDRTRPAGLQEWTWDGRDDRGHALSAGVYLLQLKAGGRRASAKLLLTR